MAVAPPPRSPEASRMDKLLDAEQISRDLASGKWAFDKGKERLAKTEAEVLATLGAPQAKMHSKASPGGAVELEADPQSPAGAADADADPNASPGAGAGPNKAANVVLPSLLP